MAQVQSMSAMATTGVMRPNTPPTTLRPIDAPRMSPGRMPEPLLTAPMHNRGRYHLDTFSPVNQNGSFEFDRVIKSGKVLRRIKKKGAWKPSWKAAFLVLRPNLLSVYKNENETELKASITLSEVTAVATVKKTNTDNVFGIFTSAKNYHFSGFSERDTSDWITLVRIEARTDQDDDLSLPAPGFSGSNMDNVESETTDCSVEDDAERPGSPETPSWAVRGGKSRSNTQTGTRKLSSLREYSANEQYTTSQSDFSDAAAAGLSTTATVTKSNIASSLPTQAGKLAQVPDGTVSPETTNPISNSQTSLSGPPPLLAPSQVTQSDPNRVARQGYLLMFKSISGVRQWKNVWAVLRYSGLSLYKSTSEYEPLKIVPIHNVINAAEIDPISKSKRFCLQVIGEEKTWKFSVESEQELEGWLGALKSVLVKRSRSLSSAHGLPPASLPVAVPGSSASGSERGKENAGFVHSPPNVGKGVLRSEPSALDDIVEGIDEVKVS